MSDLLSDRCKTELITGFPDCCIKERFRFLQNLDSFTLLNLYLYQVNECKRLREKRRSLAADVKGFAETVETLSRFVGISSERLKRIDPFLVQNMEKLLHIAETMLEISKDTVLNEKQNVLTHVSETIKKTEIIRDLKNKAGFGGKVTMAGMDLTDSQLALKAGIDSLNDQLHSYNDQLNFFREMKEAVRNDIKNIYLNEMLRGEKDLQQAMAEFRKENSAFSVETIEASLADSESTIKNVKTAELLRQLRVKKSEKVKQQLLTANPVDVLSFADELLKMSTTPLFTDSPTATDIRSPTPAVLTDVEQTEKKVVKHGRTAGKKQKVCVATH